MVTSQLLVDATKDYTYQRLKGDLDKLRKKYRFLDVFAIGKSVLGKELYAVRWGTGGRRILLNGAHHGMEWITSLVLTRFVEALCHGYATDGSLRGVRVKELYKSVTYYIVPMVNPDGVNISIKGLSREVPSVYAERILRYNHGSTDFYHTWQANARGVDLNHNYDAGFAQGKRMERELGIYSPNNTRYSGEHPESEPETQAMVKFTRMLHPDAAIAYHSQGRVIYWDYEHMASESARQLAQRIASLTGYTLDQTEGMASFSGYKDWVIKEMQIPAYTIEVGLGKNPLPISQIDTIYDENARMLVDAINWDMFPAAQPV